MWVAGQSPPFAQHVVTTSWTSQKTLSEPGEVMRSPSGDDHLLFLLLPREDGRLELHTRTPEIMENIAELSLFTLSFGATPASVPTNQRKSHDVKHAQTIVGGGLEQLIQSSSFEDWNSILLFLE